jgi:hypothetical protein
VCSFNRVAFIADYRSVQSEAPRSADSESNAGSQPELGDSMDTLSTPHPDERPLRPRSRFYFRFTCLVIALNLGAILVAWLDRSWLVFGVAMLWGPALNLCLIFGAELVIPRAKQHQGFLLGKHHAISIAVPVMAAVLGYIIILSMDLHGC